METVRAAIPMLICRDAAAEIDFCTAAFGAAELARRTGPGGEVVHATLTIGGSLVMVHGDVASLASRGPLADGRSPVVVYLYVGDVDSVIGRAAGAGARVLVSATNQPWGDRMGRIIDPAGHVWNVAARSAGNPG
jgi:PhnB protein